jgi:propionyl-CoA carboxylase alpha chain
MYTQLKLFFQEAAGISFIGPSVEAINGMGDKLESKRLAQAAGVNIIPGENVLVIHCVYNC